MSEKKQNNRAAPPCPSLPLKGKTYFASTTERRFYTGMIGRTDPAAALAARLMDTGNIFSDSGVTGGSDSGAGAFWFAVAALTDFINCGGVCFAMVGDDVEEEGVVVGAVLGVSSSGDSLLRVRLGVSSSGVSCRCLPAGDSLGVSEFFLSGDSTEVSMRGLEAFFVGDSSGGDSVATAARFVEAAAAAAAGARAIVTRAWAAGARATGTRA